MYTFKELGISPNLLQAVEELGFNTPTPIQEKVIPFVFEKENDIIGLAQTGTGKTAAFGLPIIEKIDIHSKIVQALVLVPTRELCIQITNDFQSFSKYIKDFQAASVYGGVNMDTQIRTLKKGVHIIVATPGRVLDLIKRKAADISKIKTIVLDEADEMLNMGFREELDSILQTTPRCKRTMLFSATMPKGVARIASNYMNSPTEIIIGRQNSGAENVRHVYYQVHAHDRYLTLKRIVDYNPDIYGIVFCRTRSETKDIADKLIKDGFNADAIHGDLSQAQRSHVMKRFRDKSLQMLVATDVAARGIDVSDITHVINYNLPEELRIYTHRSGRTGRADKSGVSISIVNYREKKKILLIEKIIHRKFEKHLIPNGAEICQKQLFNLIDTMENVEVDEKQIAPFMNVVNKKLERLSKEQIIKRFVSLEFNRFLEYYKNAKDLNDKTENNSEKFSKKMNGKSNDKKRKKSNDKFMRIFINIGKNDGIVPRNIIRLVNDNTRDMDINFGAIDIKNNFSFFEVGENYTYKVLNSFIKNNKFKERQLRVEIASEIKKDRKKEMRRK